MTDPSLCTFYHKIGACRHGDKCSRRHVRPTESKSILLANLYQDPRRADPKAKPMLDEEFDRFYTDVFLKVAEQGEVDSIVVCENENFHLAGNVYVRFRTMAMASDAMMALNQEWFGGRPVYCDLLPVANFHEANCRAHDTNSCTRGGLCNFMHVRRPSNETRKRLKQAQEKTMVLAKIRSIKDPLWGTRWEDATLEKYTRDADPEPAETEPKLVEPEAADLREDVVETKTTAVAKLFGQ